MQHFPKAIQALLWTWAYYVICCNGRKCLWKRACFFSMRSLHTLWASQQKRLFISNCRVDADFLKAIDWKWHSWGAGEEPWMETVDSHFHRSPAVSSIAAWPWRGEEGRPCKWCFSRDLRDRAATPICTCAYSFERFHFKSTMKTTIFSLHTFCTHAPVYTNCHHWHS